VTAAPAASQREDVVVLLRIAGAEVEELSDAICPVPGFGGGTINMAKTNALAAASSNGTTGLVDVRSPDEYIGNGISSG
jgi:hypothetical protein